jgi:Rieske Fe-S protein
MKALGDDMIESVKGFARHLKFADANLPDVPRGAARVAELDGRKVGAYRDENGRLHTVSLTCPHLGCLLSWNPDDLSWDCPCHGSRFDVDGNLLDGPAQDTLAPCETVQVDV